MWPMSTDSPLIEDRQTASQRTDRQTVGMFDSGVGGLSILREVVAVLPQESILYLADQRWAPYGKRTLAEVRDRAVQVSGQLIEEGATVVVVACHSASAAALHELRVLYPGTPFVGLEPAIKPAALASRTRVVGVLATATTFQGELFATVMDRHASDVAVIAQVGTGLAELVERGMGGTPEVKELLAGYLEPMLASGMDTLVLGCTHYPFLEADIRSVIGDDVELVDPSRAVARQIARVLEAGHQSVRAVAGSIRYRTTGDPDRFGVMISQLIGAPPVHHPTRW